ncbi:uncharacterized protein TNCT_420881 [Trichonephila clavata]|uniref:Gustatory receptor n=1 Tax=Trichonephila clavata TaxID=2740835 RepID=A0A8X6FH28_TRICU|nr:uncharacterized protein TNCT_420881 [Trichonephila clavata]
MEKVLSLILWWLIQTRIKNIPFLLGQLESFSKKIDSSTRKYERLTRISKVVTIIVILIICFCPLTRGVHYVISPRDLHSCVAQVLSYSESMREISFFIYRFTSLYLEVLPLFAISIFYILYCYTFSLGFSDEQLSSSSEQEDRLRQGLRILREFENAFSLLVFTIFVFFLCGFFKTMSLFIYMMDSGKKNITYAYVLNFISNILLLIVMVFSADEVQTKANNAREFPCRIQIFSQKSGIVNIHHTRVSESDQSVTLTGWGMFTVRKPLLLSLAAWLFTYAVILIQYFFTSAN